MGIVFRNLRAGTLEREMKCQEHDHCCYKLYYCQQEKDSENHTLVHVSGVGFFTTYFIIGLMATVCVPIWHPLIGYISMFQIVFEILSCLLLVYE